MRLIKKAVSTSQGGNVLHKTLMMISVVSALRWTQRSAVKEATSKNMIQIWKHGPEASGWKGSNCTVVYLFIYLFYFYFSVFVLLLFWGIIHWKPNYVSRLKIWLCQVLVSRFTFSPNNDFTPLHLAQSVIHHDTLQNANGDNLKLLIGEHILQHGWSSVYHSGKFSWFLVCPQSTFPLSILKP